MRSPAAEQEEKTHVGNDQVQLKPVAVQLKADVGETDLWKEEVKDKDGPLETSLLAKALENPQSDQERAEAKKSGKNAPENNSPQRNAANSQAVQTKTAGPQLQTQKADQKKEKEEEEKPEQEAIELYLLANGAEDPSDDDTNEDSNEDQGDNNDPDDPINVKGGQDKMSTVELPVQRKGNGSGDNPVTSSLSRTMDIVPSSVRIHQDSSLATDLGARAFTQGNNIHFAPGQFNVESQQGLQLLGHELWHVVQQREGRVKATGSIKGQALNDDPDLEREADEAGVQFAKQAEQLKMLIDSLRGVTSSPENEYEPVQQKSSGAIQRDEDQTAVDVDEQLIAGQIISGASGNLRRRSFENHVTDQVFWRRYPGLHGRRLRARTAQESEEHLIADWLRIRNTVVRPLILQELQRRNAEEQEPVEGKEPARELPGGGAPGGDNPGGGNDTPDQGGGSGQNPEERQANPDQGGGSGEPGERTPSTTPRNGDRDAGRSPDAGNGTGGNETPESFDWVGTGGNIARTVAEVMRLAGPIPLGPTLIPIGPVAGVAATGINLLQDLKTSYDCDSVMLGVLTLGRNVTNMANGLVGDVKYSLQVVQDLATASVIGVELDAVLVPVNEVLTGLNALLGAGVVLGDSLVISYSSARVAFHSSVVLDPKAVDDFAKVGIGYCMNAIADTLSVGLDFWDFITGSFGQGKVADKSLRAIKSIDDLFPTLARCAGNWRRVFGNLGGKDIAVKGIIDILIGIWGGDIVNGTAENARQKRNVASPKLEDGNDLLDMGRNASADWLQLQVDGAKWMFDTVGDGVEDMGEIMTDALEQANEHAKNWTDGEEPFEFVKRHALSEMEEMELSLSGLRSCQGVSGRIMDSLDTMTAHLDSIEAKIEALEMPDLSMPQADFGDGAVADLAESVVNAGGEVVNSGVEVLRDQLQSMLETIKEQGRDMIQSARQEIQFLRTWAELFRDNVNSQLVLLEEFISSLRQKLEKCNSMEDVFNAALSELSRFIGLDEDVTIEDIVQKWHDSRDAVDELHTAVTNWINQNVRGNQPAQTKMGDASSEPVGKANGTAEIPSGVNIHEDSSKAKDIGALAFAQGSDIHFAPGQFKPDTTEGQKLIGHELKHVEQQAQGRVPVTGEIKGQNLNTDPKLEAEADAAGEAFAKKDGSMSVNSQGSTIQRAIETSSSRDVAQNETVSQAKLVIQRISDDDEADRRAQDLYASFISNAPDINTVLAKLRTPSDNVRSLIRTKYDEQHASQYGDLPNALESRLNHMRDIVRAFALLHNPVEEGYFVEIAKAILPSGTADTELFRNLEEIPKSAFGNEVRDEITYKYEQAFSSLGYGSLRSDLLMDLETLYTKRKALLLMDHGMTDAERIYFHSSAVSGTDEKDVINILQTNWEAGITQFGQLINDWDNYVSTSSSWRHPSMWRLAPVWAGGHNLEDTLKLEFDHWVDFDGEWREGEMAAAIFKGYKGLENNTGDQDEVEEIQLGTAFSMLQSSVNGLSSEPEYAYRQLRNIRGICEARITRVEGDSGQSIPEVHEFWDNWREKCRQVCYAEYSEGSEERETCKLILDAPRGQMDGGDSTPDGDPTAIPGLQLNLPNEIHLAIVDRDYDKILNLVTKAWQTGKMTETKQALSTPLEDASGNVIRREYTAQNIVNLAPCRVGTYEYKRIDALIKDSLTMDHTRGAYRLFVEINEGTSESYLSNVHTLLSGNGISGELVNSTVEYFVGHYTDRFEDVDLMDIPLEEGEHLSVTRAFLFFCEKRFGKKNAWFNLQDAIDPTEDLDEMIRRAEDRRSTLGEDSFLYALAAIWGEITGERETAATIEQLQTLKNLKERSGASLDEIQAIGHLMGSQDFKALIQREYQEFADKVNTVRALKTSIADTIATAAEIAVEAVVAIVTAGTASGPLIASLSATVTGILLREAMQGEDYEALSNQNLQALAMSFASAGTGHINGQLVNSIMNPDDLAKLGRARQFFSDLIENGVNQISEGTIQAAMSGKAPTSDQIIAAAASSFGGAAGNLSRAEVTQRLQAHQGDISELTQNILTNMTQGITSGMVETGMTTVAGSENLTGDQIAMSFFEVAGKASLKGVVDSISEFGQGRVEGRRRDHAERMLEDVMNTDNPTDESVRLSRDILDRLGGDEQSAEAAERAMMRADRTQLHTRLNGLAEDDPRRSQVQGQIDATTAHINNLMTARDMPAGEAREERMRELEEESIRLTQQNRELMDALDGNASHDVPVNAADGDGDSPPPNNDGHRPPPPEDTPPHHEEDQGSPEVEDEAIDAEVDNEDDCEDTGHADSASTGAPAVPIAGGASSSTPQPTATVFSDSSNMGSLRRRLLDGEFGTSTEARQAAEIAFQARRKIIVKRETLDEVVHQLLARYPNITYKISEGGGLSHFDHKDMGSDSFHSDMDVTLVFDAENPEHLHQAIQASLEAVPMAYEILRSRGLDPDTKLDSNFYTELHERRLQTTGEDEDRLISRDQSIVSMAEMRINMSEQEWNRYKAAQLGRLGQSGDNDFESDMRDRLEDQFSVAESLAQSLRPEGQSDSERETLLNQKRQELSELIANGGSAQDQRRLMAEIKLLEPDAIGTRRAVESVVDEQQTLRGSNATSDDFMTMAHNLPEDGSQRMAALAQEASASTGLLFHASHDDRKELYLRCSAVAKYLDRVVYASNLGFPGGDADPFLINRGAVRDGKKSESDPQAEVISQARAAIVAAGIQAPTSDDAVLRLYIERSQEIALDLTSRLRNAETSRIVSDTDGHRSTTIADDDAWRGQPAVQQSKQGLSGSTSAGLTSEIPSFVKVHRDSERATEMGAAAFAQGNNIHFAPGQYQPDTIEGQKLIGHELKHVEQQAQGRVPVTTQMKGENVNTDSKLEAEADAAGEAFAKKSETKPAFSSVRSAEDDAPMQKKESDSSPAYVKVQRDEERLRDTGQGKETGTAQLKHFSLDESDGAQAYTSQEGQVAQEEETQKDKEKQDQELKRKYGVDTFASDDPAIGGKEKEAEQNIEGEEAENEKTPKEELAAKEEEAKKGEESQEDEAGQDEASDEATGSPESKEESTPAPTEATGKGQGDELEQSPIQQVATESPTAPVISEAPLFLVAPQMAGQFPAESILGTNADGRLIVQSATLSLESSDSGDPVQMQADPAAAPAVEPLPPGEASNVRATLGDNNGATLDGFLATARSKAMALETELLGLDISIDDSVKIAQDELRTVTETKRQALTTEAQLTRDSIRTKALNKKIDIQTKYDAMVAQIGINHQLNVDALDAELELAKQALQTTLDTTESSVIGHFDGAKTGIISAGDTKGQEAFNAARAEGVSVAQGRGSNDSNRIIAATEEVGNSYKDSFKEKATETSQGIDDGQEGLLQGFRDKKAEIELQIKGIRDAKLQELETYRDSALDAALNTKTNTDLLIDQDRDISLAEVDGNLTSSISALETKRDELIEAQTTLGGTMVSQLAEQRFTINSGLAQIISNLEGERANVCVYAPATLEAFLAQATTQFDETISAGRTNYTAAIAELTSKIATESVNACTTLSDFADVQIDGFDQFETDFDTILDGHDATADAELTAAETTFATSSTATIDSFKTSATECTAEVETKFAEAATSIGERLTEKVTEFTNGLAPEIDKARSDAADRAQKAAAPRWKRIAYGLLKIVVSIVAAVAILAIFAAGGWVVGLIAAIVIGAVAGALKYGLDIASGAETFSGDGLLKAMGMGAIEGVATLVGGAFGGKIVEGIKAVGVRKIVYAVIADGTIGTICDTIGNGFMEMVKKGEWSLSAFGSGFINNLGANALGNFVGSGISSVGKAVFEQGAETAAEELLETGSEQVARTGVNEGAGETLEQGGREVLEEGLEESSEQLVEQGSKDAAEQATEGLSASATKAKEYLPDAPTGYRYNSTKDGNLYLQRMPNSGEPQVLLRGDRFYQTTPNGSIEVKVVDGKFVPADQVVTESTRTSVGEAVEETVENSTENVSEALTRAVTSEGAEAVSEEGVKKSLREILNEAWREQTDWVKSEKKMVDFFHNTEIPGKVGEKFMDLDWWHAIFVKDPDYQGANVDDPTKLNDLEDFVEAMKKQIEEIGHDS